MGRTKKRIANQPESFAGYLIFGPLFSMTGEEL
jgi:hypothetical protein